MTSVSLITIFPLDTKWRQTSSFIGQTIFFRVSPHFLMSLRAYRLWYGASSPSCFCKTVRTRSYCPVSMAPNVLIRSFPSFLDSCSFCLLSSLIINCIWFLVIPEYISLKRRLSFLAPWILNLRRKCLTICSTSVSLMTIFLLLDTKWTFGTSDMGHSIFFREIPHFLITFLAYFLSASVRLSSCLCKTAHMCW